MKAICEFSKYKNKVYGSGKIDPTKKENKMKVFARKSIYAKKKINICEFFSNDNIETRRPGSGTSASKFENLLKTKSKFFQKKGMMKFFTKF